MRKFIVIFCSLMLLCCFVVPAFATGSGSGSSSILYSAPLHFDSVRFEDGSQPYALQYPFNFGYNGGYGEVSFEDGLVYGDQRLTSVSGYNSYPISTSQLYMPLLSPAVGSSSTITFIGGEQVIQRNNVADFVIACDPSLMQFNVVTVYGSYNIIEYSSIDSTLYSASSVSFSFECPVVNGRAQVGLALNDYLAGIDEDIVYWGLSSFNVAINFQRLTVDTTKFIFESTFKGLGSFNNLVQSLNIKTPNYVTTQFDATDWLGATVGSFLNFELFPGFSVNSIFTIILTIGILLWFITLLI